MIPPKLMLTTKNQAALFVLFAAASTLVSGCGPPGPRALIAGRKLLEENKYEQAVEEFQTATKLLVTNANAFNFLGVACHQAGQLDEAEKAYQHALLLDPDLAEARYNLGCLWLSENKLDQAKSALTAYTLRRANSPDGWLKLGAAQLRFARTAPPHLRPGELAGAERSFNEALRLAPQNPEALTGLGLIRLQRNRAIDAAQCFTRALKEQADYPPALLNLAIVAQQNLNDQPLALQKYREYLAAQPSAENAEAVKAVVHQLELQAAAPPPRPALSAASSQTNPTPGSQKSTVAEPVRNAPSTKPANAGVTATSAPSTAAVGNAKGPILPTVTSKSAPNNSASGSNLEVAQVPDQPVLKPAQDGNAISTPALVQNPELSGSTANPNAPTAPKESKRSLLQRFNPLNLLGSASKTSQPSTSPSAGQPTQPITADAKSATTATFARYAYNSPRKPASGNREQAERLFDQGVKAQLSQHLSEAIQAYRRALQWDRSFFDAWYNLGRAVTEAGNLSDALAAYENSLVLRPESADARYNFALVLKQANYPLDAAHELEKLLAIYPNDCRAQLALGNLYAQKLGQPAKARQHYVKVLETDPQNSQAEAIRSWLADTSR